MLCRVHPWVSLREEIERGYSMASFLLISSPAALILSEMIQVDPHPLLDLRAFVTTFPRPLGEMAMPADVAALLSLQAPAPFKSDDGVRDAVRALLRHGGFKPAGRSKPA